jgi:hypothetical protein
MADPKRSAVRLMSSDALYDMECLFMHGPTHDGRVLSKAGRDELVRLGYADRFEGFNFLTKEGVAVCFDTPMWRCKIR